MKTSERIILVADHIQAVLDANRTADANVQGAGITGQLTLSVRRCFRAEFKL